MIQLPSLVTANPELHSFAKLRRKLGETFVVREVMIPLAHIEYVAPGDENAANCIVADKRYSVVPASQDGETFEAVFCAAHLPNGDRTITELRAVSVSDHIPDLTPFAEAFYLFDSREWYFTLRANRVSGLITYWAFNSREFRVQLYAGLSRLEELSRRTAVAFQVALASISVTPAGSRARTIQQHQPDAVLILRLAWAADVCYLFLGQKTSLLGRRSAE